VSSRWWVLVGGRDMGRGGDVHLWCMLLCKENTIAGFAEKTEVYASSKINRELERMRKWTYI
jgi:hypothetical protein